MVFSSRAKGCEPGGTKKTGRCGTSSRRTNSPLALSQPALAPGCLSSPSAPVCHCCWQRHICAGGSYFCPLGTTLRSATPVIADVNKPCCILSWADHYLATKKKEAPGSLQSTNISELVSGDEHSFTENSSVL